MKKGPYAALRFRDYRNYALGGLLSMLGEQMIDVAIGWEIYERTNSPSALGFAGLAEGLPMIFFSLYAGHVSDRGRRRDIIVVAQFLGALISAGLAVVSIHKGPIMMMYGLIALAGVARAFKSPARSAFLSQLVPGPLLENAVTWNSSLFQMASVSGPMLGGFVIAFFHNYYTVYALNSVFSLAFFLLLLLLPNPPAAARKEKVSWDSLLAGVRFIRRTPVILATISLDLFAVLLGGCVALLPVYAKDILHTDAVGLGWLRAAPAVGAFAMALAMAHLPAKLSPLKRAGPALMWVVAGFGAATIGFGLSKSFWLSMAMLALTGAFDNVSVVIRGMMMQVLPPDSMRGRVSSVNYIFISASNEIGAFESGMTAAWFGPVASVVGGGIGTILVVLGIIKVWPEILKLRTIEEERGR